MNRETIATAFAGGLELILERVDAGYVITQRDQFTRAIQSVTHAVDPCVALRALYWDVPARDTVRAQVVHNLTVRALEYWKNLAERLPS